MCATTVQTREARQHTNHVEVFLGSSQQISTVDIVTVWRRGGDYIDLSSPIRLTSALQSLLWTSKVPKKSNMSNKPGFPC